MATKKKMLQAAAGNAGGAGLDVEEVFSTYLYHSNDTSPQQIVNGIDLAGEGGLVWIANRDNGGGIRAFDSERTTSDPFDERLIPSGTQSSYSDSELQITPNSDGFTRTSRHSTIGGQGYDYDYASWTFRKAPKFFDVVTYTGNGVAGRSISHSLNSDVGTILFKRTDSTSNWIVWHRSAGGAYGFLDATDAFTADSGISNPTTTTFTIESTINAGWNASGGTYVAYLFAHNDGDGEFGPDGDLDAIKCGSYTGNGSTDGPEIDLGFEPQWLMFKNASSTSNWGMIDVMRGITTGGNDTVLFPDDSSDELGINTLEVTPNGFKVTNTTAFANQSGNTYIYMAIRRGTKVPESGTEVFNVDTGTGASDLPKYISNFPVDMAIITSINASESRYNTSRLTGARYLETNSTAAESGANANFSLDYNDGWFEAGGTNRVSWMWKRAPGFFDVVAYTGTGTSGYATINHNLGVVPEMVWFKNRSSSATPRGNWYVYHKDLVNSGGYVYLNSTSAEATDYSGWASSTFAPSATGFTVLKNTLHYTNENYIAYLFATVNGISKVGSFTGNGSSTGDSQNIDCGFSSGARFVLVKAISAAGAWFLFDTERGIVAGNDSHLSLNSTDAEDTSRDLIDPLNSGFTINYHSDWGNQLNGNGQTYIFYAIA